jgi:hypothetical protein
MCVERKPPFHLLSDDPIDIAYSLGRLLGQIEGQPKQGKYESEDHQQSKSYRYVVSQGDVLPIASLGQVGYHDL